MRNPEMTKKTSTPTNPPENPGTPAWKKITANTAIARRPSMSARYVNDMKLLVFLGTIEINDQRK